MKSLFVILCFLALVVSVEFNVVNGRALRLMETAVAGCEDGGGAGRMGSAGFAVSATNSSGSPSVIMRSLAFRLASGPSEKGPGH
ncbi:hypothetical protein SLEP1_g21680 [Rubroshorea leprosula]|uniref:Uncharacterized protein n=1 Tax=Rubroshorea leprosula TaxID=152421 RepID=A0AAV5JFY6_9ROSI|nr:hypothetical protein SLEP1_g21680 [Rubroshorea leprosula]